MFVDLPLDILLPILVTDDEKKYVAIAFIEIGRNGVRFTVVPATILEKVYNSYEELKKKGYKPVDLEVSYIADAYTKAQNILPSELYTRIINMMYGEEVVNKINEKLKKDKDTKQLIETIKSIIEKQLKENTMIR